MERPKARRPETCSVIIRLLATTPSHFCIRLPDRTINSLATSFIATQRLAINFNRTVSTTTTPSSTPAVDRQSPSPPVRMQPPGRTTLSKMVVTQTRWSRPVPISTPVSLPTTICTTIVPEPRLSLAPVHLVSGERSAAKRPQASKLIPCSSTMPEQTIISKAPHQLEAPDHQAVTLALYRMAAVRVLKLGVVEPGQPVRTDRKVAAVPMRTPAAQRPAARR